jgi:transposase
MGYSDAAWERAMKIQEVMLKAMAGEIHWFRAADILGMSPRTLRRWRMGFEKYGYDGLVDRRRRVPSEKRAPVQEVERVVKLYRESYLGWNVRHFHETARREHGVKLSYSWVKDLLQAAHLVRRGRGRGRHRRRREPRACFGELLYLDGSRHAWLALEPERMLTLITVLDDATKRLLYAQLWEGESLEAVLSALAAVLKEFGIPMELYTDRAGWAFETPKAGGPVDKTHLTRVGEALKRLGIAHIPSYSPQARGRIERANRTLQGRLINELEHAEIGDHEEANRYLRERFIGRYNEAFARPARDPDTAFAPLGTANLDELLCVAEQTRRVSRDNVVSFEGLALQLGKQPGRRSCAGLTVTVRQHLSGSYSVSRGRQLLGCYDEHGRPVEAAGPVENRKRPRFPTRTLDAGKRTRRPQLPQAPAAANI